MAAVARKELVKALKATFGSESDINFNIYEPPDLLVHDIDAYLSSSDIVQNTSDKDLAKLRDTLVEECYEEGNVKNSLPLRSAFIIVIDKFSNADSDAVTARDIRDTWWTRILHPALLPSHETLAADQIVIGRVARQSALNLTLRAAASDAGFRRRILISYLSNPEDSPARRNMLEVLFSYGVAEAKSFYSLLHAQYLSHTTSILHLLNLFMRSHPVQAHIIVDTLLYPAILDSLAAIDVHSIDVIKSKSDASIYSDIAWISGALTALNILLPRAPNEIEKALTRLYKILVNAMLWSEYALNRRHDLNTAQMTGVEAAMPLEDTAKEAQDRHAGSLVPACDLLATLYTMYPSNTLNFIGNPTEWFPQKSASLSAKRNEGIRNIRNLDSTQTHSSDAWDSSTSGDDSNRPTRTDESPGSRRRHSRSRQHGNPYRSKHKGVGVDPAKAKERERRRRSGLGLHSGTASPSEGPSDAEASPKGKRRAITSPQTKLRELPLEPEEGLPLAATEQVSSMNLAASIQVKADPALEQVVQQQSNEPDESSASEKEDQSPTNVRARSESLQVDWRLFRELAESHVTQYRLVKGLLLSKDQEIRNNRIRFQRVEAAELIEDIARSKLAADRPSKDATGDAPSSPVTSSHLTSASSPSGFAEGDTNSLIQTLRSQLLFESYQKQQLVHRLGANLREQVQAGGLEADRQNLMQVVRILRAQISDSAATLNKVRAEAAESRGRLNGYSEDQQKRLETLRSKNRTIVSENQLLKSELEKAQATVNVTSESLAKAEKCIFELEAEQRYRKAEEQKHRVEPMDETTTAPLSSKVDANTGITTSQPDPTIGVEDKQDATVVDVVAHVQAPLHTVPGKQK